MSNSLKKVVASNLIWKYLERMTAQLVSLFVSIILARFLYPKDYGIVSLAMIFITFANVFVSSGFGNALVQKKDADDLDFSTVLYISLLISCCFYLIIFLVTPYLSRFYKLEILTPVLRVLGIRIIIA